LERVFLQRLSRGVAEKFVKPLGHLRTHLAA